MLLRSRRHGVEVEGCFVGVGTATATGVAHDGSEVGEQSLKAVDTWIYLTLAGIRPGSSGSRNTHARNLWSKILEADQKFFDPIRKPLK